MKLYRHLSATLILASGAINTYADSIPLEDMVVIGRYTESSATASHGQLNNDQLMQRPLLRTGEILEVVPGLVATQHSGSGKANQYFLRGFNLDHGTDFSLSVDSMPINTPSHGHGQGYADLNFIIPELINTLTYKKGSYYADLGDFSGTGGAEIETSRYQENGNVEIGIGKDNYSRLLATGGIDTGNKAHFIYGLEVQGYDGPWENIEEDVDKKNLWLKQIWGDDDNAFSITAMLYDNSWNSADQIPARAVEQGIISELGSIDNTLGGESSRYSLSGNWLKSFDNSTLDVNLYAISYDLDLWSNFTYFTDAEGDQFEQVDDRDTYGWHIRYALNHEFNTIAMTNTFGSQLRHDAIDELGLYSSNARSRTGVYRADKVDQTSVSGYWENRVQWNNNFRSIVGLRYDNYHFDVDPIAAQVASTIEYNGGTASDSLVTGSMSLAYEFNANHEAYFSIGQGFHSNDARGTTIQFDPTTGDAVDAVDQLVPTLGYELGWRSKVANVLEVSVALWHLDIDSELLFVGDAGTTEDTGVGSERQGVELTLYTQVTENTTLDLEYSYTDAEFNEAVDGSTDIPGALQSVASVGVNTRWVDGLYTQLKVRYFDEYPLDGGATGDASTMVNLRLGYQFNSDWSAKFDILNLLDSDDSDIAYYYESQLATESDPVEDLHYHVFEPRTYRFYLNYRF
jgi:outer membrane cobalamin receptor